MDQRRDNLSTADLADDRPSDTERPRDTDWSHDTERPSDTERHVGHADEGAGLDNSRDDSARDDLMPGEREAPVAGNLGSGATAGTATSGATGPLMASGDAEGFRARWTDVQTGFVDEPRQAVERADSLVAEVMQHLAKTFADERDRLEHQWARGDDVSTDDLRGAFQRYRWFFERLLAT
jgi:hypothetical protein